ncbi:MAG TPA: tetratricopeptide repeat protein [Polyangiales bacterium]|nr:tetratricopeptide repeat protein [Polyangiales bacterium]
MNKRPLSVALGLTLLITGTSAVPLHAHAQRHAPGNVEAGRGHFDRGVDYYRDGNINAALIEFKRAYDAAPNYRVLYNLGQVANALNDYVEAQRYFQRYLQDGGAEIDPERRAEVNALITKLGGRIASVTVVCNVDGAQIYVDDVPVGVSPLAEPLRVSAGTRRIAAAVSGKPRSTRVVEAVGGERLNVEIEAVGAAHPASGSGYATSEQSESGVPGPVLWLGIATGALAIGTAVVGILAAQDSSKFHDALNRSTTSGEINRLHDRAATKALLTDIMLGATAITGGVTLFFALTGAGKQDTPPTAAEPRARLNVGLGSLELSGQF